MGCICYQRDTPGLVTAPCQQQVGREKKNTHLNMLSSLAAAGHKCRRCYAKYQNKCGGYSRFTDTIGALVCTVKTDVSPEGKMAPTWVHISSWVVCIHLETNWSLIS